MVRNSRIRLKVQTSDFEMFEINDKFYNLSSKVRLFLEEKERRKIYMRISQEKIAAAEQKAIFEATEKLKAADKLKADAAAAENNEVASDEVQTLEDEQNGANATTLDIAETTPSTANETIVKNVSIAENATTAENVISTENENNPVNTTEISENNATTNTCHAANKDNADIFGNTETLEHANTIMETSEIEQNAKEITANANKSTEKMDTTETEPIPAAISKQSYSDSSDESDFEDDEDIYEGSLFLPNVNAITFLKVLEWVHHYKEEDELAATQLEMENRLLALKAKKCYDEQLSPWEQQFLRMSKQRLCDLIMAAEFLDLKKLCQLACKPLLKKIRKLLRKESGDNSNAPVVI